MAEGITKDNVNDLIRESEEFIETILRTKYLDQETGEKTWEDLVHRFKRTLEAAEYFDGLKLSEVVKKVPELMEQKKFIPAGSILANFGRNKNRNVSLSNCYFIPIEKDSIDGIYEFLKNAAKTYSWRGGVGTSISVLRPKGARVNNAALTSTGAVSFMPLISENTNTIGQNGRRGAAIITIDAWHPDVVDFVKCKTKPEDVFSYDTLNNYIPNVYYANISIKMPDAFFEAVEKDDLWTLEFPDIDDDKDRYNNEWTGDLEDWKRKGYPVKEYGTIKARDLLKQIAESNYKGAEPGVLFWDTVLKNTPAAAVDALKPEGVNPCGEQQLAAYANCNLSALNIFAYVVNPFTLQARLDITKLKEDLFYALAFGDFIIDYNRHPLEKQNKMDVLARKVGIEYLGIADALAALGLVYGSKESIEFLDDTFEQLEVALFEYSITLAELKGPAPVFASSEENFQNFISSSYIQRLLSSKYISSDTRERLEKYKLRNSAWSNNGPTGSIAIIAGNLSSGIEPIFKIKYTRTSRLVDRSVDLIHLPLLKYIVESGNLDDLNLSTEELKKKYNYVEADEIKPTDRIKVQGTLQKWFTDSIASTINLPNDTTPQDIYNIFLEAWKAGLKGVTVFRAGSIKGVLEESSSDSSEEKNGKHFKYEDLLVKKELLSEEDSKRYIVKWKGISVYLNVVHDYDGSPLEVFAQLPIEAGIGPDGIFRQEQYMENLSYWHSITRLISLALRYSIPLDEILKQLKKSSFSIGYLTAILLRILSRYPIDSALYDNEDLETEDDDLSESSRDDSTEFSTCPVCGKNTLVRESGCNICKSCGYSRCD